MNCYIVSYDLCAPRRDYNALYTAIKSYRYWAKITESTWAILSDKTVVEIRDFLKGYIDDNDRLIVVRSGKIAAWSNALASNEWLRNNLVK